MGQQVYIKLKTTSDTEISEINKILSGYGIKNEFTTEVHNQIWLDDINTHPQSSQRHLKPTVRDLTMEELKKNFPSWTEVGKLDFDVAFGRTSKKEAAGYSRFIKENQHLIEYLEGADELISRYDLKPDQIDVIKKLTREKPEPEKLTQDEQHIPGLQNGLFLCDSFSAHPFWVIFGKVDSPKFLKTSIYKDDLYNNLYRDKNGFAYMMIPLLPINERQLEFVSEVYSYAYTLGLRESYNLIIPLIYGMDLTNYADVTQHYIEYYTNNLVEKFTQVLKHVKSHMPYSSTDRFGFFWNNRKQWFVSTTVQHRAMLSVLTCLLWAVSIQYGPKSVAKIMSDTFNIPFVPQEFKLHGKLTSSIR